MSELAGFHHVALTVRDCEASARWYCDVLGLVERFAENSPARSARVLQFPDGTYAVGLVRHDVADTGFDPRRLGLDHVAFTVPTRDDLDRWAERFGRAGVPHSGVVDVPAGAILNFADPDGVALALFWDRPG